MFVIPDTYWEVKEVPGHGRGVFAKKDIEAGVVVGDYLGKMIHPEEEDDVEKGDHFYLMYYHDYASIYPEVKKPGVHLLNHSCAPNTWMYTYMGHTLYFAIRHIFPGEQLTVSYQISPQDKECKPCTHLCSCGSVLCFQTMHLSEERYNKWAEFHDREEKKTQRERVRFGEYLQPLDKYPKSIPDNPLYTLFGAEQELSVKVMDSKIPSREEIRKIIRSTGRTIQFAKLDLKVHGVFEKLLISQPNPTRITK